MADSWFRKIPKKFVSLLDRVFGSDDFCVKRIEVEKPKFKLAFVTDWHENNELDVERLLGEIIDEKPDAIVIGGDFINTEYGEANGPGVLAFAIRLRQLAPCYFVGGNHEVRLNNRDEFYKDLKWAGLECVESTCKVIRKIEGLRSSRLIIGGMCCDDAGNWFRANSAPGEAEEASLRAAAELIAKKRRKDPVVFLAHRPEIWNCVREAVPGALCLCGHTHGGLIRFGKKAALAPGQGLLPKYSLGLYENDADRLYVCAGLGGSRIGIKPELCIVEI